MTVLTEGQHKAEFIVSEANGSLSREVIKVLAGQVLQAGHVLGKVGIGTATGVAVSGNIGNGTISDVSAGTGVKAGTYGVTCIEPAANGGTFAIEEPGGVIIGSAMVGTPYVGQINFTLNDGATDFAAGIALRLPSAAVRGNTRNITPPTPMGRKPLLSFFLIAQMPRLLIETPLRSCVRPRSTRRNFSGSRARQAHRKRQAPRNSNPN